MNATSTARVQRNLDADNALPLDLLAQLKRVNFLLSSARLVIFDREARAIASDAVREAQAVIDRAEA